MGQLDGVGRVYRADLNQKVERELQVDRTDRDRKRRDKDDHQDEEPHDTVEIHDEAEGSEAPVDQVEIHDGAVGPEKGTEAAPKPKAVEPEDDGLDISA
ncbi:MAG: hypothetical protein IH945_06130 [Armatimonadetes bacterium]|nr:hypothetical protein [Armatimonadota bacterium]